MVSKKSDLEAEIIYSQVAQKKAEVDAIDYKDQADTAEGDLEDIKVKIQSLL